MKKIIISLAIIQSLAGCASWFTPVGEDTFDCNRRDVPKSPHCRSMRSVDDSTSGSIPPTRYDRKFSMAEVDELNGISQENALPNPKTQTASNTTYKDVNSSSLSAATFSGMPVRQGPIIQRVWIQKFTTENDTLVQDTYVYKEVLPTHWSGFPENALNTGEAKTAQFYPHKQIKEQDFIPIPSQIPTTHSTEIFGDSATSDSADELLPTGAVNLGPSKPN